MRASASKDESTVFLTSSRGQTLHIEGPHILAENSHVISLDEHTVARADRPTAVIGGGPLAEAHCEDDADDSMDMTSSSE
mmetsp:Transcript_157/g.362  ORF Transcript_157/g.362 Transcript_157/m.362 type:complete len:80 (-) Transcript_157:1904-2143(-)